VLRSNGGDSGWIGNVAVAAVDTPAGPGLSVGMGGGRGGGGRVTPVPFGTPLYAAGVDEGDTILSIDDAPATPAGWAAISRKKPGDSVKLAIRRRDGKTATTTVTVKANPSLEIVPAENAGQTLTDAQRAMRDAWLGTKVK
jgi:predicted metalloprotease with PDZ domain